jgi:non-heme chloroperoxidase
MSILRSAAYATLTLGLVHAAATWKVRQLRARPNRYPLDALVQEPEGEEVFIERPDGSRIRAVHTGEGKPIVFAHGYGIDLVEWNIVWQPLRAAGYRLIAFDQRGHGKSVIGSGGLGHRQMAGDYRAVLEHFDVRDGILVGHSMGGFLSTAFLIEHADVARERLRGAVLIAALAGEAAKGSPQNRLQIPLIRSGIMSRVVRSEIYGSLFGMSLMGDEPFPAAIDAFRRVFMAQKHEQLTPILESLTGESYYARLAEVPVPAVVVCGEKDGTTPSWHSQRLGTEIPGARNIWLPGKGHLLNWEAPEAIVEAIESLGAPCTWPPPSSRARPSS